MKPRGTSTRAPVREEIFPKAYADPRYLKWFPQSEDAANATMALLTNEPYPRGGRACES